MNIHGASKGALDAAGVRRVGLEVGRSVRIAGGAGTYCVATRTACYVLSVFGVHLCAKTRTRFDFSICQAVSTCAHAYAKTMFGVAQDGR